VDRDLDGLFHSGSAPTGPGIGVLVCGYDPRERMRVARSGRANHVDAITPHLGRGLLGQGASSSHHAFSINKDDSSRPRCQDGIMTGRSSCQDDGGHHHSLRGWRFRKMKNAEKRKWRNFKGIVMPRWLIGFYRGNVMSKWVLIVMRDGEWMGWE
jgi:hypothetical protein